MINPKLLNTIVKLSKDVYSYIPSTRKHTSFIVRKNTILSTGFNQSWKSHPLAYKYNYRFAAIHSELAAILKYDGNIQDLRRCKIINVQLNKELKLRISKPCKKCQELLFNFGFNEIYFSTNNEEFERM